MLKAIKNNYKYGINIKNNNSLKTQSLSLSIFNV